MRETLARPFSVAVASCTFEPGDDPDALLTRYHAMTGWANALREAGADAVDVVQQFRRDAVVRRKGVTYHFVRETAPAQPPPWFPGLRMTGAVRRLNPSAVHVDGLLFPILVRHLRWRLPRRSALLVQDHGGFRVSSATFRSALGKRLYRVGLGGADGFLFTARGQAEPWLRARIVRSPTDVHEVLEASTDMPSWTQANPPALRPLPGRPALLWVGRLDANKDPLSILDGFARTAASLPEAALTLVYGDDELLTDVEARIAQTPALRARIHLRGSVDRTELPPLYAGADFFLLGSHHEVACFSLIEALSFGVTPIVTDIPAFRAITDQGQLGALFPPGDAEALARAIERLGRSDFAARRRLVQAHFDRELSWAAVGRKALAIYRAAAAARSRERSP
jgi:glycosyltransferase involved in cell wall biosynthesis